jgi:hypothetical protein
VSTVRWGRQLVFFLVAALVLLGAASHALAHKPVGPEPLLAVTEHPLPPAPTPGLPSVPRVPGLPWQATVPSLATLAFVLYRPRRALASALVVCFAALLFETGIHSVHHGTDSHGAARCAVHSVSQHLAGTDLESPDVHVLPVASQRVVAASTEPSFAQRPLGFIQGRAPPLDPLA